MSKNFFKYDVTVDGEYFDTVILCNDYSKIDYIIDHVKDQSMGRSDCVDFNCLML